jgi:N-methylhydantoinase A
MASAARIHAIEGGKDPRAYPVFAFGGAGPVHAYRVAEILRAPQLIVPLGAGVTSTVGFLAAPLAFDFVRTYFGRLEDIDWQDVNRLYSEMETEGREILAQAGVVPADMAIARTVEMRYAGQGHEVAVPMPAGELDDATLPQAVASFEEVYRRLYERTAPGNPIEALTWRVVVSAPRPDLPLEQLSSAEGLTSLALDALKGERPIYLPEDGTFVEVPVFDRYRFGPGAGFGGPAIIEERESTLVVGRGGRVTVDELLNVVVDIPRID